MESAAVSLLGLAVPAYFVLQILALRRLQGGWRTAAWVILALMAPVFAVTLYGLAVGSNLWPVWLLFASPVACMYLVGVFVVRWLRG